MIVLDERGLKGINGDGNSQTDYNRVLDERGLKGINGKVQFSRMKVFHLPIERTNHKGERIVFDYRVKLGEFTQDGSLNLYAITEL